MDKSLSCGSNFKTVAVKLTFALNDINPIVALKQSRTSVYQFLKKKLAQHSLVLRLEDTSGFDSARFDPFLKSYASL